MLARPFSLRAYGRHTLFDLRCSEVLWGLQVAAYNARTATAERLAVQELDTCTSQSC